jgi:YVTN family beta-propeller protein
MALIPGLILSLATMSAAAPDRPYLCAPAIQEYARHDPGGTTILPSGRFLRPLGKHTPVARWPHGLTLSPGGERLFVASAGVGQLVADWRGDVPGIAELTPVVGTGTQRSNGGAAAFSPDGRTLYWSSGDTGAVYVFDAASREKVAEVSLNAEVGGRTYHDSYAMDLQLSPDGRSLYCADVTNFRVVVVDTTARQVVGSVRVGRYPYALAVTGQRVCVANIGMFEYSAIPAPGRDGFDRRGLTFPPFGFPSREATEGVDVEGRHIPGLGDPNVLESFSVWTLDASDPTNPRVTSRIKTGLLVGAPADNGKTVGGSAPNFVLARGDSLWVSNGTNDTLERIDLTTGRIVRKVRLQPSPLTARLRGVGPSGMALSPDGRRLYVAESGINAIAVLEASRLRVLGHLPTAWYPYRVVVSGDGKSLAAICFKGFGNGPSGGKDRPTDPFMDMRGALTTLAVPPDADLPQHTATVRACNGMTDRRAQRTELSSPVIPTAPGTQSEQIKYVVFITKENHTYDTIFDHIPGANDDPSLLRWGDHQRVSAPGQPTLEDVAVMTNHNGLARQFTVSDNFYMEPEASGVGHRWLVGVQPNNFCQMTYTLGWGFSAGSTAPGRRASFGSNGSIAPEDYPEAGAMWEHLASHGVPFRNYGEGFEFAGVGEDADEWKTGAREVVNIPMSKVLFDNTCREFPIFNMNIPDQYRADWFAKDVTDLFLSGKQPMPRFLNVAICNDHGTGPNAAKGYPYVASWMADNDLALGRIVDFLSHTPYWRNMAIFVTEDDAGGEPDHVDAQRSVLLVISPWARRGYVSHRHTTIPSMHRTLYQILGLPALNMFDALANDFSDCFTTEPDYRPYEHVGVDPRVFDPEKAKDPNDPDYAKARLAPSIRLDDPEVVDELSEAPGSEAE